MTFSAIASFISSVLVLVLSFVFAVIIYSTVGAHVAALTGLTIVGSLAGVYVYAQFDSIPSKCSKSMSRI